MNIRGKNKNRLSLKTIYLITVIVLAVLMTSCNQPSNTEGASQQSDAPAGSVQLSDAYSKQIEASSKVQVDTSSFKKDPPYKIATIVQGPTNGWGTIFDVVMNERLKSSGKIADQLYVPWDFTTESQANGIEDAITKKVDAILLTSLSRAGLAAPVERAAAAGIPVIICMAGVETDKYIVEVSRNIPRMGYDTAKSLAEALGGKGNIVLLHGIAGVDAAEFWRSGVMEALKQYPDIKVVSEQYGQWSVSDSLEAMRAVLAKESQIDGVWVGGLEMGVSVINAFKEAGRPMPLMAGTNPINGFLRLAIENNVKFFAAPFPPAASQLCVDTMFDVLAGKTVPKYIDVADKMAETSPFSADEAKTRYQSQFNDDWIGPKVVDDKVYLDGGFAAQ